jgi:hypothetical protein
MLPQTHTRSRNTWKETRLMYPCNVHTMERVRFHQSMIDTWIHWHRIFDMDHSTLMTDKPEETDVHLVREIVNEAHTRI